MTALNTDLLKKLSRKWTGQIGAAGVSDAVGTTIPLSSTTNLATDTAVVATIDRVDANGVKTPTLEESVIGVVSGSNLLTCVRGAEGTAQSHAAGAVVEILVTAKGYNDIIDAILVEHSQLGVHSSALVTSLKASGAVVNTGTSDVTIVTPKAIADSYLGGATSNLQTQITALPTSASLYALISTASYTTNTGSSLALTAKMTDFVITAQNGALKFNNPSGASIAQGWKLVIRIKDNATPSALTYDTYFRSVGATLPTTTVASKVTYIGLIFNSTDTKWDCVAVNTEA